MSWKISYKDAQGNKHEHRHTHNESNARGWADNFTKEYGGAKLEHVADGPYDHSGKVTHIQTTGDYRD